MYFPMKVSEAGDAYFVTETEVHMLKKILPDNYLLEIDTQRATNVTHGSS